MVHDAAGAPSDEGREYVVTDANLIVTFAKAGGGCKVLEVVPCSLRTEAEGRGE